MGVAKEVPGKLGKRGECCNWVDEEFTMITYKRREWERYLLKVNRKLKKRKNEKINSCLDFIVLSDSVNIFYCRTVLVLYIVYTLLLEQMAALA